MLSLLKTFHWHTKFEGIVSGLLDFFNSMVSVSVFENMFIEIHFQDLFNDIWYFSLPQIFVDFLICIYRGKMEKFMLKWFLFGYSPLIFFRLVFLANYDRYETETFRVYYLWYNLSIGIEPPNANLHHGKMVCPILKHVSICYNG